MPQVSVTFTDEELAELKREAGEESLSNYVRSWKGLPSLKRGRGTLGETLENGSPFATREKPIPIPKAGSFVSPKTQHNFKELVVEPVSD